MSPSMSARTWSNVGELGPVEGSGVSTAWTWAMLDTLAKGTAVTVQAVVVAWVGAAVVVRAAVECFGAAVVAFKAAMD